MTYIIYFYFPGRNRGTLTLFKGNDRYLPVYLVYKRTLLCSIRDGPPQFFGCAADDPHSIMREVGREFSPYRNGNVFVDLPETLMTWKLKSAHAEAEWEATKSQLIDCYAETSARPPSKSSFSSIWSVVMHT